MKIKLTLLIWFLILPGVVSADPLFKNSPFFSLVNSSNSIPGDKDARRPPNKVLLLPNGYDALLLRVHLIRNASTSINLQTFIWRNDECGRLIMYELIEAAKRGVTVRILADHFTSEKNPDVSAFLATVHENLKIKHYRPVASQIKPSAFHVFLKAVFKFKDFNQRMHNKVMIFDDTIALTGGRNIENTYFNHSTHMNFKDLDIMAVGPVVSDVCKSFNAFWNYRHSISCRDLTDVAKTISEGSYSRPEKRDEFDLNGFFDSLDKEADTNKYIQDKFIAKVIPAEKIEFVSDAPGKNKSFWLHGQGKATKKIKESVEKARHSVILQSPYLVLSENAREVFKKIGKNAPGLNVTVSTNSFGSTDNVVAYSANYRLRPVYLQKLNFNIYEYKPRPSDLLKVFPSYPKFAALAASKNEGPPFLCIHSKALVVDDKIAFIGSYNMDPRSGNLNTEAGLLIEDENVAALLKKEILNDCSPGNRVIARKKMPLQLDKLNAVTEGVSMWIPGIDIWPVRNTSSFELIPGKTSVPPDHSDFYAHYRDTGSFPDMENDSHFKQIVTRIYKAVGSIATPLF